MKILVLNAGSSSLKYQLFNMESGEVLAKGLCERIGTTGAVTHKRPGKENYEKDVPLPNHDTALETILSLLTSEEYGVLSSISEIDAVGHRVIHGGELVRESSLVNDYLMKVLEDLVPLNPLHAPPAIAGIKACLALMPNVPQVGVFDTSFYSDIEPARYIYPIPYELYENEQVRRYGFHGTSHRYVSAEMAKILGREGDTSLKVITCHLGNGSSITAVEGGKAVDTSMGFTPQEGIVMGTRSGSIDPTIVTYLMRKGYDADKVEEILNKKSGLLGISGISNDCRNLTAAAAEGNERAKLALDILVNSIKRYIGMYVAEMNGLDALVFTAGIGENQWNIRQMVCENMEALGIEIDVEKNKNFTRGIPFNISLDGAKVQTWIIPTDEEYMIAIDTARLVAAK